MSTTNTIFRIESAPGDAPRTVEQPNGDLLVTASAREVMEALFLKMEADLGRDPKAALARLEESRRLLGIDTPRRESPVLRNLLKVRPI